MTYHVAKPSPEQSKRMAQWREDCRRRTIGGKRLWRCWHCDNLDPWGPTHGWYGSIKEEEDGLPIVTFCSDRCRDGLIAAGLIPSAVAA